MAIVVAVQRIGFLEASAQDISLAVYLPDFRLLRRWILALASGSDGEKGPPKFLEVLPSSDAAIISAKVVEEGRGRGRVLEGIRLRGAAFALGNADECRSSRCLKRSIFSCRRMFCSLRLRFVASKDAALAPNFDVGLRDCGFILSFDLTLTSVFPVYNELTSCFARCVSQ
jgi:hypothetical protein